MKTKFYLLVLPLTLSLWACSKSDAYIDMPRDYECFVESDYTGDKGDPVGDNGSGGGQTQAGRVTAGEWNDLDNWLFWSELMTSKQATQDEVDFTQYSDYWQLYTNNRIAVHASSADGQPLYDAEVRLITPDGTTIWSSRTDINGNANLWFGLTQLTTTIDNSSLAFMLNNEKSDTPVSITHWGDSVKVNYLVSTHKSANNNHQLDIAFIVDATGSMSDEINFLKADLENILQEVNSYNSATIRTSAVFYRDNGDEYLTRSSNFGNNTIDFISQQQADGGGDYPEAVHTALEVALQELSWIEDNAQRIAFLLLDAPPHKQDDVISSLQQIIPQYAAKGIKIVPIAASGVDKPTEFFCRFTAIATNGTYIFITNDSGIGNDHIQATVGDYKVELLRDIIIRIISQNM